MDENKNSTTSNSIHSNDSARSIINVVNVDTVLSDFDSDSDNNEPENKNNGETELKATGFQESEIIIDSKTDILKKNYDLSTHYLRIKRSESRLNTVLSQLSFKQSNMLLGVTSIRSIHVAEYKCEVTYDDHLMPMETLLIRYNLNLESGISTEYAEKQLLLEGKNVLAQGIKTTIYSLLVRNLFFGFSILLWIGGFLSLGSFILDMIVNKNKSNEYISLSIMLFFVVISTGLFGFYQDYKATMVMDAFSKMIPMYAKVLRDGQIQTISCENLVVGDIVIINSGDIIPADIRLIEATEMRVDMSALTGESEPQTRTTECTHRFPIETKNLAFFSSYCTQGNGKGIVIATGDHTMIGHIAILAKGLEKDETPIAIEIKHFTLIISIVATIMGLIFFGLALYNNSNIIDCLIYMLGIMVANVPEGIVVTVTACLTLTTKKMAKKNCLIKEMESIETLGCTTIICSDKTGTLTQNLMTVNMIFYDTLIKTVSIDTMKVCNDKSFSVLCLISALCLTAEFRQKPIYDFDIIRNAKIEGDASESAILRFVEQLYGQSHELRKKYPKVYEMPFNSVNKFQLSIHKQPASSELYLVIKGAPEIIVKHCTHYCLNGETVKFSDTLQLLVHNSSIKLAGFGQRILGFADLVLPSKVFKEGFKFSLKPLNFPLNQLRFCGIIGLIDPPKPGVRAAVSICQKAGIRIVMVTGDHPMTAMAIARDIGILTENCLSKYDVSIENNISLSKIEDDERFTAAIITGDELRKMMPNDVKAVFLRYKEVVFARMSPQQKLLLVESAQSLGHIVAVTGDGVNDSPALKKANIGIAMGIAGNDVSKQAADIILLDDNFASIVTGIEEGRLIYENLKKSIAYTVTSNIPEMTPYIAYILWGIPLPLTLLYILIIDLGTDLLPAISIAYEKSEFDIMHYPPRDRDADKLVNDKLISYAYCLVGIIQTFAGFFGYFLVMGSFGFYPFRLLHIREEWECPSINDLEDSFGQMWTYEERMYLQRLSQTTYFVTLVITQVADAIICKTRRISVIRQGMSNWVLNASIIIELLFTCFLVYTPFANNILKTAPVAWFWWLPGIPFAILLITIDEFRKYCIRNYPNGWVAKNGYY